MNASDTIAIVSACTAGLALVQSWRASRVAAKATSEANDLIKQQVVLQDRLTQIEQSREHSKLIQSLQAILRAELRQTDVHNWRLVVANIGHGTARKVTITLDGRPLVEHGAFLRNEQEAKLIGPESEISYCLAIHSDCHPPFEFEVTWDDGSGQQGRYSTTLTF